MSARVQRPLELGAIRTARPARDLDPPVEEMNGAAELGETMALGAPVGGDEERRRRSWKMGRRGAATCYWSEAWTRQGAAEHHG